VIIIIFFSLAPGTFNCLTHGGVCNTLGTLPRGEGVMKKKKKQIDTDHTQVGIGHGHKYAGQGESKQRDRSGGGTRKHWRRSTNLIITRDKGDDVAGSCLPGIFPVPYVIGRQVEPC
jgi:hypothetical protein